MLKETLRGRGLEIGGPSEIFASVLPVYGSADLDNCNFAASTVWEGSLAEGKTFHYGGKVGQQFVSEAFALPVASASYGPQEANHHAGASDRRLRCGSRRGRPYAR
jgi:hypothetical protein